MELRRVLFRSASPVSVHRSPPPHTHLQRRRAGLIYSSHSQKCSTNQREEGSRRCGESSVNGWRRPLQLSFSPPAPDSPPRSSPVLPTALPGILISRKSLILISLVQLMPLHT